MASTRTEHHRLEALAAVCILVLGAVYMGIALTLPMWAMERTYGPGIPGSGLLPRLIGATAIAIAFLMLLGSLRGRHRAERANTLAMQNRLDSDSAPQAESKRPTTWLVFLLLVAFTLTLETLGFLVAAIALMSGLFWLGDSKSRGVKRVIGALAWGALVVGIVVYVLAVQLGLQLPLAPGA